MGKIFSWSGGWPFKAIDKRSEANFNTKFCLSFVIKVHVHEEIEQV